MSVSVKGLQLGKATLNQFNAIFEYEKDKVIEYETDSGEYDRLIRIEIQPNQLFYFDGDLKRLVSFNSSECTLSSSGKELKGSENHLVVVKFLKDLGQPYIETRISNEGVWVEIQLNPNSGYYSVLEYSSKNRLEKCRTKSDY